MENITLILAALVPAIVLCVYVFKMDRVEKEPAGLLLKLFGLGAVACVPAAMLEIILDKVIKALFVLIGFIYVPETVQGVTVIVRSYDFVHNFFGVALVEEGLKLIVLLWITRRTKDFNSLFDGIIYAVFVSLGFAAFENVLYVLEGGFEVALLRAFLSVPGHMFFGVMMGYSYSIWSIKDKIVRVEEILKREGRIPANVPAFKKPGMVMCLVVPMCAHGFFNFCCTFGTLWATLILLAFVLFMYVHCFRRIIRMSKADRLHSEYVRRIISSKYPGVFDAEPVTESN